MADVAKSDHSDSKTDFTETGVDEFREVLRGNVGSLKKHSRIYPLPDRLNQKKTSDMMQRELELSIKKLREKLAEG